MDNEEAIRKLIEQKEALATRTDLSEEDRDKLARRLRREIRRLGGSVRTFGNPDVALGEKKESITRSRRTSPEPIFRDASKHPEELAQYIREIEEFLQDQPVKAQKEADVPINVIAHGFDLTRAWEVQATPAMIVERFLHRWGCLPTSFSVVSTGSIPGLYLWPLPENRVHRR